MMKNITLLDIGMSEDGHRASYVTFLAGFFVLRRLGFCPRAVFSREPVLVPMIEESFPIYILTVIVRSLMGRRTVGFLFRPMPALEGKEWRLRIKYVLLRLLTFLPTVKTLTILPFSLEPRFEKIADGWIYDPQLWDLEIGSPGLDSGDPTQLLSALRVASSGRKVCMALGRQDKNKGFNWFARLYVENQDLRDSVLFAFGGKVSSGLEKELASFVDTGGFACNRFVTDDELLDLYAGSDLIWGAYDIGYDQASGILGRASQLGIPVIIRRGSLNERLCRQEGIRHISIDESDTGSILLRSPTRESSVTALARSQRMRTESMRRLFLALGFKQ